MYEYEISLKAFYGMQKNKKINNIWTVAFYGM